MTSISYYTFDELVTQRQNCIKFGMTADGIEYEIRLVVDEISRNSLIGGNDTPRFMMNTARDIMDEIAMNRPPPFDQDAD